MQNDVTLLIDYSPVSYENKWLGYLLLHRKENRSGLCSGMLLFIVY